MKEATAFSDFERFFALSPEPLCVLDTTGSIKAVNAVNQPWERELGNLPSEPAYLRWIDLLHPDDRDSPLKISKDIR